MQKLIYSLVIVVLLFSCDDSTSDDEMNEAPTIPILINPTNNLLCISNELSFEWEASNDSNGDSLTYQIEVSKDNQFGEIEHTATVSTTTQDLTLEKGSAYYWRVKAIDSQNESSDYSATFNLFTESDGITNHLPFAPELISPELNNAIQDGTTTLEWSASDTDGDPLTYDIYFGTENPPTTMVSENQDATTFSLETVPSTNYYWKIIVKDDKNGQTVGQVWNFSTN